MARCAIRDCPAALTVARPVAAALMVSNKLDARHLDTIVHPWREIVGPLPGEG